jgi:hypothetical protein
METKDHLLVNDLQIDSIAHAHLKETAVWARFLGIVGIIISALLVFTAFFAGSMMSQMETSPYSTARVSSFGSGFLTVVYLIGAAIGFFLSILIYRFGTRTKNALLTSDQESLNSGLSNLRVLFRAYGIITIVYLAIIVIAMISGIAATAMA